MTTPESTSVNKPLAELSTVRPLEASTEFKVGIRSVPYLADHGFQDLIVLPGSFYIDVALELERERFHRVPSRVRNATFHNLMILSAEDTVLEVETKDHGDGHVEYTFYEAGGGEDGARPPDRQCAATVEVSRISSTSPSADAGPHAFAIETFQAQAQAVTDSDTFYRRLRENGNQYGPHFQNVSAIWRADDQCLGKLSVPHQHRRTGPCQLHPTLLDSVTQLLASFIMEKGRTFVLRSIERIEIASVAFPDTLWGHATLLARDVPDENGCVGNVRVFDQSGKPYLELSGVTFKLLDRGDAGDEQPVANLVIAANFTAEPLEDSLKFWGDHFGVSIRTEFAPYNQLFQQLLDAGSAFGTNREGVNAILLGLEEWAGGGPPAARTLDEERAAECFGDRARYVLPNGLEIVHLNPYETDYVYREIFEDQCYLRHGIRLQDGDTVVDIGANIGLFSLFVMSRCKNPRIYAFEPAPVVYDLLKANCRAHGSDVRAVNAGVSDKAGTATFTFYERSSVFSGFHADEAEDRAAIQTVVRNMLNGASAPGEWVDEHVNELTADRLRRRSCECQLISVSDIISEHQLDTIHLLKIDAEKSELDILNGIAERDWPKISQIVMEIHDRTGEAVKRAEALLGGKGFRCAVEHEKLLERSGLFNLYATRGGVSEAIRSDSKRACALRNPGSLERNTRDFCAALRSFMSHSAAPLLLCVAPRTPAVECDAELKAALNDAEQTVLSEAGTISNIHTISSAMLVHRYPVADYSDPHGHALGHIPYTPGCYAAMGTALFRTLSNLKRRPFKVIVLDCDNTLWKGVCGEDGPRGIEITPPYRGLQEFMIHQMNAGMLLCLCTKNNEKDVLDVFEQRTDLPLKREHLAAWRINWNRKSENTKSLAKELNLGLDSFIFVDDNPVDCADVRIHCPGVLTLQLPRSSESFVPFLNHIWAFDHSGPTGEDQKRTRMYQEDAKRKQFRGRSLSLRDYLEGLQLRVEVAEATEEQLGRVSQLTLRTNQFNLASIRRSEKEIRDFLNRDGASCLVVRVVDRFGDYGLAGVVMYEAGADCFKVDTLLLSCRVLGRGVEHAVVSHLGQRAARGGKRFVELTYRRAERNLPALKFLRSLDGQHRSEADASWIFSAERLATVEYNPDEDAPEAGHPPTLKPRPALEFGAVDESERLQRIGEDLNDIGRIVKAIEEQRLRKQPVQAGAELRPDNSLQAVLLDIWRSVLGRPQTRINDNFFEAGGTSLRAVQVIARLRKELKQPVSIVSLFECPTVALLAARLSGTSGERQAGTAIAKAALRGQRRRYKTSAQHVS